MSSNLGSLGIYDYMESNGECVHLSPFYIQWAQEFERAEDFPKAAEVYKKGMKIKAEPLERIEQEYEYVLNVLF